jgi:8-oxo-dGTP pyrophosphatase MutT (NUDIX family)
MSMEYHPVAEAATVIVVRRRQDSMQDELFMVRRSSRSTFMPDALVFPGGRVEPEDGLDEDRWIRAAARECREEAMLDVPLHELQWMDTWMTPSEESKRRFLARFFLVRLGHEQSQHAKADGYETESGRWIDPLTALREAQASAINLAPPTYCILQELANDADLIAGRSLITRAVHEVILPKVVDIDGQAIIVLPHDPHYFSFPGQEMPCPARSHRHPRRFAQSAAGWLPQSESVRLP